MSAGTIALLCTNGEHDQPLLPQLQSIRPSCGKGQNGTGPIGAGFAKSSKPRSTSGPRRSYVRSRTNRPYSVSTYRVRSKRRPPHLDLPLAVISMPQGRHVNSSTAC